MLGILMKQLKERKKGWREEGTEEGEGKKRGSDLPD
jgi:hypothetical protein